MGVIYMLYNIYMLYERLLYNIYMLYNMSCILILHLQIFCIEQVMLLVLVCSHLKMIPHLRSQYMVDHKFQIGRQGTEKMRSTHLLAETVERVAPAARTP